MCKIIKNIIIIANNLNNIVRLRQHKKSLMKNNDLFMKNSNHYKIQPIDV